MTTRIVPAGPRSALQVTLNNCKASNTALQRILEITSTKLYPRLALFEELATYKGKPERRASSQEGVVEARRAFLDSFAYICDVERGGGTVTATGLQRLPQSNTLWLAGNEGIRHDVEKYAERILSILDQWRPGDHEEEVERRIFHLVVDKCSSRLKFYQTEMRKHARNCRMQLRREAQDGTGIYSLDF